MQDSDAAAAAAADAAADDGKDNNSIHNIDVASSSILLFSFDGQTSKFRRNNSVKSWNFGMEYNAKI